MRWLVLLLLLIVCACAPACLGSLPTPAPPPARASSPSDGRRRLPGLCRRLRRRRVTVLCHLERFCWRGRSPAGQAGQRCPCPRGSRCSHFFIRTH